MEKTIWLSKEGSMFGPFSEEDVMALRASGELSRYGWIWRKDSGQWSPVHPRPGASPPTPEPAAQATNAATATNAAIPELATQTAAAANVQAQTAAPAQAAVPVQAAAPAQAAAATLPSSRPDTAMPQNLVAPARAFHVIFHDQRTIVAGVVQSLRDGGCIVVSEQGLTGLPQFRKGAKIWVNLLDEAMDRTENVEATVAGVRKQEDPEHWRYDLSWSERPQILKGNS